MKKIIILSGLILIAWGSYAQTQMENYKEHGLLHGEWKHHLHFTTDQRKQMMTINKEYHAKAAELFKNDNLTLRQYKSQLIALQKDKKSKLRALLTDPQKDQLVKWKKQAAENVQVMAAARLEKLKIRLNLTDEQAASIKSSQTSLRNQAQSVRENENLLPQQKREEYKSLMAKRKEAIVAVLIPDQRAKFEEMEHDRDHFSERRMN